MPPFCIILVKSCTIIDYKTDSYILYNNLLADRLIPVYQRSVITYIKGENIEKGILRGL